MTDLNNNAIISGEDAKKLDNATSQSNLLLQQSLNQIVNGLGNSFVPSAASDLLSSQISFLNQSALQSAANSGNGQDTSQDAQVRRAITGARNFNAPIMVGRSQTSPQQQQPNAALFKQQQTFNSTSNWPTTPNPTSAWSTGSQTLLNQPTSQQWNVFNNTLNSLSNIKPQQNAPRLSGTNLSSGSISPLKQKSSQLAGSSNAVCQPTTQSLLNTQQLGGQLSPLSPNKFRQNRAPLMNVNTLNAMLMMQVRPALCTFFVSSFFGLSLSLSLCCSNR